MNVDYPRKRNDLITTLQKFQDITYYVIKHPLTNKYFRIKGPEYFILQKLDGKTTYQQISAQFQERFNIPLKEELFKDFVSKLEAIGFLQTEKTERELAGLPYHMHQRKNLLSRIVFIKLKAFDPDRFLSWLSKKVRFVFARPFLLVSLFLVCLALGITLTNWNDLKGSFQEMIGLGLIVKVWLAILLITALHETAHALTCKYFGGEVHEMGFLLLYFQPCFYCNVSDAWLFPEKRKKVLVTFAGAYLNVLLWATSTIIWRVLAFDTWLSGFLFTVLLFSAVTVIFNFNPLIKLDGYYLLSDYLEIPNLRRRAFEFLKNWLARSLLGPGGMKLTVSRHERKVFVSYGILALSYTLILVGFFFYRLERFLVSRYQGLGFILFLAVLFVIFSTPTKAGLATLFSLLLSQRGVWMKPKRIIIYVAITVALLAILFLVKLELKVSAECEIQPLQSYSITTTPDGYAVEEIFKQGTQEKRSINLFKLMSADYALVNMESMVKEGEMVKEGDLIALFTSNQNLSELSSTQAKLEKAIANYQLLKKGAQPEEISQLEDKVKQSEVSLKSKQKDIERLRNLHQNRLISDEELEKGETNFAIAENELEIQRNQLKLLQRGARPEELTMARSEIEQLKTRVKFLEEQISSSQIKSPIRGLVTSIQQENNLIMIAKLDTVTVLIKLSEKDLDAVRVGQKTKLKVRSYPWISFHGKLIKISHQAERGTSKNMFTVVSEVPNPDARLKPGMTGHAKVYCGKRNILNLLTRRLVRYLRVEVWSWW